ncbi:MAG: tetratricopeptide repeat protein [Magnetococcales bacterium]|nr:tetratricopeptide repeat protein [Magnetococcales bacterium]
MAESGRWDKAEAVLREVMRLDATDVQSRTELGRLLAKLGRYDEAEAVLREVMRLDATDVQSRTELGRLLAKLGRYDEAEAVVRELLEISPRDSYGLMLLQKLEQSRDLPEAQRLVLFDVSYVSHEEETGSVAINGIPDESGERTPWDHSLRLVASAKEADFMLDYHEASGNRPLNAQGREQLTRLVAEQPRHVVVRFYGQRHGLLTPEESESFSLKLERAIADENHWQERVKAIAGEWNGAELVRNWLLLAAGETDQWQNIRDDSGSYAAGSVAWRLVAERERLQRLVGDKPFSPDEAWLRNSLRRLAETLLPVPTEPTDGPLHFEDAA